MSFVFPLWYSELVDSLIRANASANRVPCLTANALLQLEEAVMPQLEDWLEKPQRHEWLAVRDVASRYDAKTKILHDCSGNDPSRALLAGATGSLGKDKPDRGNRPENIQRHEWLVVGEVASRVRIETKTTPGENREDLNRPVLAGLVGSTIKREGQHLGDGSDKPQEDELVALRDYGSHSPAKTDEFFADIHEILSGKTE